MIKHNALIAFAAAAAIGSAAAQAQELTFSGTAHTPVQVKPEASTGLNMVYVLYGTVGASATFRSASGQAKWLRFSSMGGAYAEEVQSSSIGSLSIIELGADDMGYIIEDGDKRYYFWITNYEKHIADLKGINILPEQDCDRAHLQLEGNASRITYFTINGQPKDLDRELEVEYQTMAFNEETEEYDVEMQTLSMSYIDGDFSIPAPLCDTQVSVSGDRFLRQWGMEQHAISPTYDAVGVEAHTTATQQLREVEHEQSVETDGLGGSGPVDITFHAAVTDAAVFREWQLSRDGEFDNIFDRYRDLDMDYTFREQGTTYVRFMCANSDGSCEYYSETYEVFIGESALLCPNAFSPGASEGVNDEWRVSYRSIVQFECHIFNGWGQEMFSTTDPAIGWDGKYKGKYVPAGAYFYVINAVGTDGRRYKLSGDINIIKGRPGSGAAAGSGDEAGDGGGEPAPDAPAE